MTIQDDLNNIEKNKLLEGLSQYKIQANNAVGQLTQLKINCDNFKTMVVDNPLFSSEEETEIVAIIDTRIAEIKASVDAIVA